VEFKSPMYSVVLLELGPYRLFFMRFPPPVLFAVQ
jgi:hypothetical protein